MYHNFSIHSSADEHLDGFRVPVIVNSAAKNIGVHVSFSVLISSRYMPSSGIVKSYGSINPSFLRNLYTALHSDYYIPTNSARGFYQSLYLKNTAEIM